jgi:hypothetical protein
MKDFAQYSAEGYQRIEAAQQKGSYNNKDRARIHKLLDAAIDAHTGDEEEDNTQEFVDSQTEIVDSDSE